MSCPKALVMRAERHSEATMPGLGALEDLIELHLVLFHAISLAGDELHLIFLVQRHQALLDEEVDVV